MRTKEKLVPEMKRAGLAAMVAGAALLAFAAEFPAPDAEGTVTLTEAGAYATGVPSGTAKLVVDVSGTATLTGATTGFTGAVVVKNGSTLIVTEKTAIVNASSVTVESGGTFEPQLPGPGQATALLKMPISIAGTGNGTGYAFRFTKNGGANNPDSVVNNLILTEDATIDCSARWGVSPAGGKGLIDLQGHTLTRTGGNNFMLFSAGFTEGKFLNTNGELTFQTYNGKPFAMPGEATNTIVEVTAGNLTSWASGQPIPFKIVLNGGWLRGGAGTGKAPNNTFSGPVEIKKWVSSYANNSSALTFGGPLYMANTFCLLESGTLYVTGRVYRTSGALVTQGNSKIVIDSPNAGNPQFSMQGGCFDYSSEHTNIDMFRCGNGGSTYGVFHHIKGGLAFGSWDTPRVSENSNSYGAYVFEDGAMYPSNSFYVAAENALSHGIFIQRGGLFEMRNKNSSGQPGVATVIGQVRGEAFFVQTGGTNDTRLLTKQAWRTQLGINGGSNVVMSISGSNTLYTTDSFIWGAQTNPLKAVLAIKDGATLQAMRFEPNATTRANTLMTLWLDGGILMPRLAWGWNDIGGGEKGFLERAPEKCVVAAGGVTVDTSLCDAIHMNPLTFCAPEGEGIKTIALPTDNASFSATAYKGPVPVDIYGPAGSYGASAYAEYDFTAKKLTKIVVLSPGCNYDATTKIYLRSPNARSEYLCTTFELTGPQASGGLTKRGRQEARIYATGTYTGGTTVEQGTLSFGGTGRLPENTPLCVRKGASINNCEKAIKASVLSGQGNLQTSDLTITASLEVDATEAFAEDATPLSIIYAGGVATFGEGAVVNLTIDEGEVEAVKAKKWATVLTAPGGIVGSPALTVNGQKPEDGWRLKKTGNSLKIGWSHGFTLLVR